MEDLSIAPPRAILRLWVKGERSTRHRTYTHIYAICGIRRILDLVRDSGRQRAPWISSVRKSALPRSHPEQRGLGAAGVLAWNQGQRSEDLPADVEAARIRDRISHRHRQAILRMSLPRLPPLNSPMNAE